MNWWPKNPAGDQVLQSEVADDNPDRSFIAHLEWTALEAATAVTAGVHAAHTCTGAPVTLTTGIIPLLCPKNITVTSGGTAGSIKDIVVTIVGTNILDEVITEALPALTLDQVSTKAGAKAFKTVTSITIPAHDGTDATTEIGFGEILGLPYERAASPCIAGYLDSVLESTTPVVVNDATAIESNTVKLSNALTGTPVDAFFVV